MELLGQRAFALTLVESPNSHPQGCTIYALTKKETIKAVCYYLSAFGFILPVFVEAVAQDVPTAASHVH